MNTKQINDLCTGVKLVIELEATEISFRKFLTVQGYIINDDGNITKPDKYLNSNKINDLYFEVRVYELSVEYYINEWDVTEDDLKNEIYLDGIKGINQLELILNEYIADFSELKPEWDSDNLL